MILILITRIIFEEKAKFDGTKNRFWMEMKNQMIFWTCSIPIKAGLLIESITNCLLHVFSQLGKWVSLLLSIHQHTIRQICQLKLSKINPYQVFFFYFSLVYVLMANGNCFLTTVEPFTKLKLSWAISFNSIVNLLKKSKC